MIQLLLKVMNSKLDERRRFLTLMVFFWILLILYTKLVMDDEEEKIHKSFMGRRRVTIVKPQKSSLICDPECIGSELKSFLENIIDSSTSFFLIEPWLLVKLIDYGEEREVKRRGVMSFGILEDDILSFPRSILHDQKTRVVRGHIFHKVADTLVHFVIFYRESEYYRVDRLPHEARWNFTEKEFENIIGSFGPDTFGKFQAIYDLDQFEKVVVDGIQLQIPEDVKEFLDQVLWSRMVKCGNDSGQSSHQSSTRSEVNIKYALHHMKSILREIHVPVVLFGDKLLEWSETCRVNSTSTNEEVDVVAFSKFASYDLITYLHSGLSEMRVDSVTGFPHNGFYVKLTLLRNGVRMNLHFLYEEAENYLIAKHIHHKKQYYHLSYPKFDLCSSSFIGEKILVPCRRGMNLVMTETDYDYYSYVSKLLQNARQPSWPKSYHSHGKNFHVQNPFLYNST